MAASYEPIVGRYLHLDLRVGRTGSMSRRPGAGIPLLCLHTAGADAGNIAAVLNDPRDPEGFPRDRLRPALARQIVAAGRLAG